MSRPTPDPHTECDCLQRIARAQARHKDCDQGLRDAVAAARADGNTWTRIATVLGTSRQAASKRYGLPPLGANDLSAEKAE